MWSSAVCRLIPTYSLIHTQTRQEEVLFVLRDVLAGATIALVVFTLVGLASAFARWCCKTGDGQQQQQGLREPLLLLEEEENVVVIPPDRGAGAAVAAPPRG